METVTLEDKKDAGKYLNSTEFMESELRRIGFFVGGLNPEGIAYHYKRKFKSNDNQNQA